MICIEHHNIIARVLHWHLCKCFYHDTPGFSISLYLLLWMLLVKYWGNLDNSPTSEWLEGLKSKGRKSLKMPKKLWTSVEVHTRDPRQCVCLKFNRTHPQIPFYTTIITTIGASKPHLALVCSYPIYEFTYMESKETEKTHKENCFLNLQPLYFVQLFYIPAGS